MPCSCFLRQFAITRVTAAAFVCLLFLTGSALPQSPSPTPPAVERKIVGQVRLAGQPAPKGVRVSLVIAFHPEDQDASPEAIYTETDSTGRFVFSHLELLGGDQGKEAFAVSAIYTGYNGEVKVVDLTSEVTGNVDLNLEQARAGRSTVPARPAEPTSVLPLPPAHTSNNLKAQQAFDQAQDLLFRKHDAAGSIAPLKQAVKLDPWYGPGYMLLGLAEMQLGQWDDAKWAFEEATKVEPGNPRGFLGVGSALNQQGNYLAASKALEHSLDLREDSAESHYELARSLFALGKWQEASPHTRRAIELNPDYAGPYALMGNIDLRAEDADAALNDFRTYLKLDPQGALAPQVKERISQLEQALTDQKVRP